MMDGTFFFLRESEWGKVDEPPNRPWQSHVFQGRWVPVHPLAVRRSASLRAARGQSSSRAQEMGRRWKINLV